MSHSLDQFQTQRDVVLQDAATKLAAPNRDALLAQAILQRYSKDRPREVVQDIASDGTPKLALPDAYEEGFSEIESIEYPIGQLPPQILLEEEWQLYRDPSALKIILLSQTPNNADELRVTITARHKGDGTTVPDPDFEAVCDYAGALCFEAMAAIYAQTGDSTSMADTVNYRTKSQEYLGLAKAARARYFEHVGVPEKSDGTAEPGAVAVFGTMSEDLAGGFDRMTHPKATR